MTVSEKLAKHPFAPWTIALYGITHTGKSSQCARLAQEIYTQSALRTLWFLYDEGDTPAEADIGIAAGYIEVIDMRGVPHPFHSAKRVASGMVPMFNGKYDDEKMIAGGKFVRRDFSDVGLMVFDSGTAIADGMFRDLSAKSALHINVGGDGAMNFVDGDGEWGRTTVGSSNRGHYNVVQVGMADLISRLKQLAMRTGAMLVMTFAEDRGEQESVKVQLIGPKTKGSAQTTLLPGWFKFTYRMVCVPGGTNKEPKHLMWTERHKDGGVEALANRRFPILGEAAQAKFPPMYDPADLVLALRKYQEAVALQGEKT